MLFNALPRCFICENILRTPAAACTLPLNVWRKEGGKLGKIIPDIFEIKIKIIRNGRCIKSSDRWQR